MTDPLRPLPTYGDEIGLDNQGNLRVKGGKVILNHAGTSAAVGGGVKTISSTTYTVLETDNGSRLRFTSGSSITVTVPSGLSAQFECSVEQGGAGQITFSASGTTINNASSHTKTSGQHAVVALLGNDADVFTLTGQTGS